MVWVDVSARWTDDFGGCRDFGIRAMRSRRKRRLVVSVFLSPKLSGAKQEHRNWRTYSKSSQHPGVKSQFHVRGGLEPCNLDPSECGWPALPSLAGTMQELTPESW